MSDFDIAPLEDALDVLDRGFGDYLVKVDDCGARYGRHRIAHVVYVEACNLDRFESPVRDALDQINWQLIAKHYLDPKRIKAIRGASALLHNPRLPHNEFLLSPIIPAQPRPLVVYHATSTATAVKCLVEGILPSTSHQFENAYGKIHVMPTLDAATEIATYLATAKSCELGDFSILEAKIDTLLDVRVHLDLHSDQGIVLDRVRSIPASLITQEFRMVAGSWQSVR